LSSTINANQVLEAPIEAKRFVPMFRDRLHKHRSTHSHPLTFLSHTRGHKESSFGGSLADGAGILFRAGSDFGAPGRFTFVRQRQRAGFFKEKILPRGVASKFAVWVMPKNE
jgi:hypothetical protein